MEMAASREVVGDLIYGYINMRSWIGWSDLDLTWTWTGLGLASDWPASPFEFEPEYNRDQATTIAAGRRPPSRQALPMPHPGEAVPGTPHARLLLRRYEYLGLKIDAT
jgi:hypothetical protein